MALFNNIFRRLRFWKRTNLEPIVCREHDITRTLKQYEYFIFKLQHILLWEDPSETVMTIAFVNLLFWIFASLEWRFYGIFFTILLCKTVHELWTLQIWPEIRVRHPDNDSSVSLDENSPKHESLVRLSHSIETSQKIMKDSFVWLKVMREKKPGVFCTLVSSICFVLSLVGRMIPGLAIVYILMMSCLLAPGIWVNILPEEIKQVIISRIGSLHFLLSNFTGDQQSEDEYLPEATNEELSILSQFVDSDIEEKFTPGSSGTQLSIASLMPSHEDVSDSLTTFSDLELNLDNGPRTAHDVDDFSDDSSDANDIVIDFKSGHFNGDDSSSDEEVKLFSKDLKFTEAVDSGGISNDTSSNIDSTLHHAIPIDAQKSLSNFISSNIMGLTSAIGQSYIVNVLNRSGNTDNKHETIVKNDSSNSLVSEEDFEMISHDDVS